MPTLIKWHRAVDGFVESHCKRWRIVPLYCGSTRAQDYELWLGDNRVARMCGSQSLAKAIAEHIERNSRCSPL